MAETIQQMQQEHQTGADKAYRRKMVAMLREAATNIEFGLAEVTESTRESWGGKVYIGVKWVEDEVSR